MKRAVLIATTVVMMVVALATAAVAASSPAPPVISASGATITWPAVATADGYNVYRNGSYSTTVTARSYTAPSSGAYMVTAFDKDVTPTSYSTSSNTVNVTVGSTPSGRPAAPVISVSGTQVSWPAVPTANGYNVYRDNAYLTTVNGTSYNATTAGTYTVTAFDTDVTPTTYSVSSNSMVVSTPGSSGYQRIFNDDFSGSTVSNQFAVPGWTSAGRDAVNRADSCAQSNGILQLSIKKVGHERHACYLISNTGTFGPGTDSTIKVEYRANVSQVKARGAWFAGWMYSLGGPGNGQPLYAEDGNPATGSEYDVFEYMPTNATGFNSAVHDGSSINRAQWTYPSNLGITLTQDQYHTFTLEWNKNCQAYSIDGHRVWTNTQNVSSANRHSLMLTMEAQTGVQWGTWNVGSFADNLNSRPAVGKMDWVHVDKKQSIDAGLCT